MERSTLTQHCWRREPGWKSGTLNTICPPLAGSFIYIFCSCESTENIFTVNQHPFLPRFSISGIVYSRQRMQVILWEVWLTSVVVYVLDVQVAASCNQQDTMYAKREGGKQCCRASLPTGSIGFGTTWVLWLTSMKFSGPSSHLVVACSLLLHNYFAVAMVDSFLEIPRTSNSKSSLCLLQVPDWAINLEGSACFISVPVGHVNFCSYNFVDRFPFNMKNLAAHVYIGLLVLACFSRAATSDEMSSDYREEETAGAE